MVPAKRKKQALRICRIGPLRTSDTGKRVEFDVTIGERKHHVYYQARNARLTGNIEASIAAALLPLMMSGGGRCEISGHVSERFISTLEKIQEIYYSWEPRSRLVNFVGDFHAEKKSPKENGTGAFFSAGVDSFYTFLKHEHEISDLIFVHGFDISLEQRSLYNKVSDTIRYIGEQLGKNVIEIETNIRFLLDPYNSWEMCHGAAMASLGHLLSSHLSKIYIASTSTYATLQPLGSHPFLDPLWSTEALEFIHDGCEASRTQKTAFLAESDLVLRTLRVCWHNPLGAYNCGKCRKCLLTMIDLYAAGKLDECTTFDTPIDIRNVYKIRAEGHVAYVYLRDNLLVLEKKGLNPELQRALRQVLLKQRFFGDMAGIARKMLKAILQRIGAA